MPRPRKSAVRKYHDRVAHRYDHSYEDAFWQWHDRLTWDYIKPRLPQDIRAEVIDLGCGTAKWGAKLLKSGYTVTCLDISPQMLDQARHKIEAQGDLDRASFVQADLVDMAMVSDDRFALAVALGDAIGCTQSPRQTLKHIRRILHEDGILIATFDNQFAALDYFLECGDVSAIQRFLRDGMTHWLTRDADEQFPIHTFTPREIDRLANATGFEVIEVIGKTVLPMRRYKNLLETPEAKRHWAVVEKQLSRDPNALTRASHLQVTFRAIQHP